MSKAKWMSFKEEVKRIRQEIARFNSDSMFASADSDLSDSAQGFASGTIIRMQHSFAAGSLDKKLIREVCNHFGALAYADFHGKMSQQVTLRFKTKEQTVQFLAKVVQSLDQDQVTTDLIAGRQMPASDAFKESLF